MSSRLLEKERRRDERLRREAELAAAEKRSHRRALVGFLAIGVLALAGVTFAVLRGGGETLKAATPVSASASSAPFGQHYAGLVQRREVANVPTMMQTMNSHVHFHPQLKVFANGKPVTIPANVGIAPRVDGMQMTDLHTHDDTGTIHVEGMAGPKLGQFFTIWGVPFSAQRLGPYRARDHVGVRMWVDGKPSRAYGDLKLADGQRIVVSYGAMQGPAPGA